jgi:hypothetical protein
LIFTARSKLARECGPLRDRGVRRRFIGDVGAQEFPVGAELPGDPVAGVVHVGDDDLAALGGEHRGGRGTQPGAASRDEKHMVLDFHGGLKRV